MWNSCAPLLSLLGIDHHKMILSQDGGTKPRKICRPVGDWPSPTLSVTGEKVIPALNEVYQVFILNSINQFIPTEIYRSLETNEPLNSTQCIWY